MAKPLWARPFHHGHVQEELSICRKRNNISSCPISVDSEIIHAGRKKSKEKRRPKTKEKSLVKLPKLSFKDLKGG